MCPVCQGNRNRFPHDGDALRLSQAAMRLRHVHHHVERNPRERPTWTVSLHRRLPDGPPRPVVDFGQVIAGYNCEVLPR